MGNDFNITAGNSLSLPMSIFSHQGGTLSKDDQDEQHLLRSGMETHVFLEICLGHEALSLCSHLYEFKEQWLESFARKIPSAKKHTESNEKGSP